MATRDDTGTFYLDNSVRIKKRPDDNSDIGREAVGNTSNVIRYGDPIIWDNSNTRLDILDAAADDENFVGIALETYDPDRTKPVAKLTYARKCIVEVTVSGLGAQAVGTPMAWSTDGSMALAGTANTAGWLHKAIASGATKAEVLVDVALLAKQVGIVSA